MASIARDEFESVLTAAVEKRSRVYKNSFALSVRWEEDDTNACQDTEHFQNILSTLNLNPPKILVLKKEDDTPGWSLNHKVRTTFRAAAEAPGKSIVLIHYAGHGVNKEGRLFAQELLNRPKRIISLQRIIDCVLAGDVDDFDIEDTDTVFVFDCCHSYAATRAINPTNRSVEILAATSVHTPFALSPPQKNTITRKLRAEIVRRKQAGHHSVILADVMASITHQSPAVTPSHHVLLGASICLKFASVQLIDPSWSPPALRVLFSVHITQDMTTQELNAFIRWIDALHPGQKIELDGVYTTSSTLLILQAPYAVFADLANYPGITLISTVTSPNRRSNLLPTQRQRKYPESALKENNTTPEQTVNPKA